MPLTNIIDNRRHEYRYRKVNAVVESTCYSNGIKDGDEAELEDVNITYEQREHISLTDAVEWAGQFPQKVTLFLYDEDDGIYPLPASAWETRQKKRQR